MIDDVLIVGAGVAGLAAARTLADAGAAVTVVDRAPGVGGRCATRRAEGRPVDHGVSFLHGSSVAFRRALDAVDSPMLDGWPSRIRGTGTPCQPSAFRPGEFRVSFADGVSAFPKALARGLSIQLRQRVHSLEPAPDGILVRFESGENRRVRRVLVALAVEQAAALISKWPDPAERPVATARVLLAEMGSKACLTVIAGYPDHVPPPSWDVTYPEDSAVLHTAVHDTSKRRDPRPPVVVLQGRPCWSRSRLEVEPATWEAEILAEAGRLLGDWASRPRWTQRHAWRYARVDAGCELSGPLWIERPAGGGLGFAGEAFGAGGGLEAAWRSGVVLADRVLGKEGG